MEKKEKFHQFELLLPQKGATNPALLQLGFGGGKKNPPKTSILQKKKYYSKLLGETELQNPWKKKKYLMGTV